MWSGVAPIEVRYPAVPGDNRHLTAVGPGRHHAVVAGRVRAGLPTVQEHEPPVVGRELEVVKTVDGAIKARAALQVGHLCERENQAMLTRFDIEPVDAIVLRLRHVAPGIGHTRVAVAGPLMLQAGKVQRHRLPAIAAEGVDRARERAHDRPGQRVPHNGDKTSATACRSVPAARTSVAPAPRPALGDHCG